MKVCFTNNFNNIFTDLLLAVKQKGWKVPMDYMDADKVVLWNEVEPDAIMIINLLHKLKKKAITLQHGRYGTSKYYPPFNQQIISDKLCVWGTRDRNALLEAGHPADKVEVVGTTIFNHLKYREDHEGTNVVFCPEHWGGEIEENRLVAEELRKLKNVNIITKILQGEHKPEWYDNTVTSNRRGIGHLDICADVLAKADLIVSIAEGTFELMAQYLNIPVVLMEEWKFKPFKEDKRFLSYRRMYSEASKKAKMSNLCEIIEQQLENPDELEEERALVIREEGGTDIQNPIEKILNIIKCA